MAYRNQDGDMAPNIILYSEALNNMPRIYAYLHNDPGLRLRCSLPFPVRLECT